MKWDIKNIKRRLKYYHQRINEVSDYTDESRREFWIGYYQHRILLHNNVLEEIASGKIIDAETGVWK